jgi:hypothetical protein
MDYIILELKPKWIRLLQSKINKLKEKGQESYTPDRMSKISATKIVANH